MSEELNQPSGELPQGGTEEKVSAAASPNDQSKILPPVPASASEEPQAPPPVAPPIPVKAPAKAPSTEAVPPVKVISQ